MSAIVGAGDWGWGFYRSTPEAHRGAGGAQPSVLAEDAIAKLEGLDAREAVESLDGDFAEGQLPDLEALKFPGPIAEAFYWSNGDILGIVGPVGSGKTTTLMHSRLRRAIEMPKSVITGRRDYTVTFTRETYRQLWSTSIPSYLEVFPKDMGHWSGGRGDPVTHVIEFEDEYGPITFTARFLAFGDNITNSMRGLQTTDLVLNEMDTMPEEILTVGIGRIDRAPGRNHFAGLPPHLRSWGQIVGDFNAPDEDNYTYRVFYDEEERKRMGEQLSAGLPEGAKKITIEFYNQPGFGEPGCENTQNLSPSYYERQIAAMKLAGRGDMIDRLVYNKVVYLRVGDPVWRNHFNRRIHVNDGPLKPVPGVPLRIGLDQGFKGAAVIAQCVGFARWRILAELHLPNERLMASVFGMRLADLLDWRFPGMSVEAAWGDMAGEHGASQAADENATWNLEVSKAAGIDVRPQVIGTNRIQPRLEAVRAALDAPLENGEPGIVIDPGCKFLIRGFEARYVWTDKVNEKTGEKAKVPDKSFTEANIHDALQYLLLSEHLEDGTSPYANRLPDIDHRHYGGRKRGPRPSGESSGLSTEWNIHQPYGDTA
ncbi:MAG: hypothetical protein AAFR53_06265 [Pseudomonadota bacterium]